MPDLGVIAAITAGLILVVCRVLPRKHQDAKWARALAWISMVLVLVGLMTWILSTAGVTWPDWFFLKSWGF